MRTVSTLPRPVREIENQWITLADGCRVATANQLSNGLRLGPGIVLPERAITFS